MSDQDRTPMADDLTVAVETVPEVRVRRRTRRSNPCRIGALQVHSRKHCVNYPPQEERHDYATDVAGAVASHYCLTMSHSTTSLSRLSAALSHAEPPAPLSMVRPQC